MIEDLEHGFDALPPWVELWGAFEPSCRLRLSHEAAEAGQSGALKVRLLRHGGTDSLEDVLVSVGALRGRVTVTMAGSGNRAEIGRNCVGNFDLKLWRESEVTIGAGTSANEVKIVMADSSVRIGCDCMMSDEVLIQSADQHGLLDATTLEVLNGARRQVVLEDHVWLGRRTTIMPDVHVGFGSIVASGAVVTKDVPALSVAAGVPARIIRNGTTWSRSPDGATDAEAAMIRDWREANGA